MTETDNLSIRGILETDELAQENVDLVQKLISVFEYTQYLLDDESHLTKTLNFNSVGKAKLDKRILELFMRDMEEEG